MELQNIFVLNNADVLFEYFDDEIVAINLKNGYYYSINRPGIPIWKMLAEKISPQIIINAYLNAFPAESSRLEKTITRFISELAAEGLVLDSGIKADDTQISEELIDNVGVENTGPGENPVLEKYTDQQELLLLDPIHEVSDLGWPEKKEKSPDND